ncbi:MAG: DUF3089 domain-containing protein [Ruminiclostridium sp.]|nr:DUF3089 domain-containing protein [Ruminiclostridium sp.]
MPNKTKRLPIIGLAVMLLITAALSVTACSSDQSDSMYSNQENWAYLETDTTGKPADVFFICPTVYGGDADTFNMAMDDTDTKEAFLGAINMEKGIYDENCRVFAPYYRQAALSVYEMAAEVREEYLSTAYEDVKQAFTYYLEQYNDGRPIVVAGFSQGADLSLRLLKDYFSGDTGELLVACYAIGWSITEEELQAHPHLTFAQGETDTGVIIAFNSEAEGVSDSPMIPQGTKTLAINPLNWRTDGAPAHKSLNKGACFTDYSGEIVTEIPQLTGAYIDEDRGSLRVVDVTPEEYPPILSIFDEGVYHLYDYQFFYRNLQENVSARIAAYLDQTA